MSVHIHTVEYLYPCVAIFNRQRSYQCKYTSSRPITEVKCVRAQIVLGWGTAWEHWVTLASLNFLPQVMDVSCTCVAPFEEPGVNLACIAFSLHIAQGVCRGNRVSHLQSLLAR